MGRFYKTASPQMVDFMYKIPEQALYKAIEGVDKQIDTEYLYKTETEKLLQKKSLSPDEQEQKEILEGYQKGIDEVSQLLSTSSLGALKDKQRIRDLQSKIYQDVTRGKLAAQYANYDIRAKHYAEELKRATDKDGTVREEDLAEAMKKFDEAYAAEKRDEKTGELIEKGGVNYNPTTGKYRTYGTEKLVDYYDSQAKFAEIAKDWKPSTDTDITKEKLVGNYYVTTKEKDKLLPLNELTLGVYNTMLYDPKAMSYYTQKARIRSGGDKAKFEQEMTRLFGERVDPGNPYSRFKMEEVKDAEGKTVMQKVKKMKDGKEVEEEVPMTRMANPGELFMAAQVAADKQDIKEIVRSETLDLTEQAKSSIDQAKEIAVAKAKADDEEKRKLSSTWNIATNEVTTSTFGDFKTNQELTKSFINRRTALADKVASTQSSLTTLINGSTLTPTQKQTHITAIKNLIDKKDWAGLQSYVAQNEIKGLKTADGKGVGTGIEELAEQIKTENADIKNDETAYTILYNKTGNTKYKDGKTYLQLAKEYKDKGYANDSEEVQELNRAWNKLLDTAIGEAKNTTSVTSSNFNNPNIDSKTKVEAMKALNNLKKDVPTLLGNASEAMFVLDNKGNLTNFNSLTTSGKFDYANIKDDEDGKRPDATKPYYEVTRVGIVPQNLKNVQYYTSENGESVKKYKNIGEDAIMLTIKITDGEQVKEATVYVPKSKAKNQYVDEIIRVEKPYSKAKNHVDDAKRKYDPAVKGMSKEEKEKVNYVTPEGYEYYPYLDEATGGTWIIDGKPLAGDLGTNLYAEKLKSK
jgi:hypothetical protein